MGFFHSFRGKIVDVLWNKMQNSHELLRQNMTLQRNFPLASSSACNSAPNSPGTHGPCLWGSLRSTALIAEVFCFFAWVRISSPEILRVYIKTGEDERSWLKSANLPGWGLELSAGHWVLALTVWAFHTKIYLKVPRSPAGGLFVALSFLVRWVDLERILPSLW